jgi:hypothetical protein
MKKIFILLIFIISCSSVDKISTKIEKSHYDLYKQKVLICTFKSNEGYVIFENPMKTKQWECCKKKECERWNVGDTLFIEYNSKLLSLEDSETFWSLKPYNKIKY